MSMPFFIRQANLQDTEDIASFNLALAKETEEKLLDMATVQQGVRNLFLLPNKGFYWVAEQDQRLIGQLMITLEWSDWRNADIWWIQSVFVLPPFRKQGVFKALFQHVKKNAEESKVCSLRLYAMNNNSQAHQTYLQMGMKKGSYEIFELPLTSS